MKRDSAVYASCENMNSMVSHESGKSKSSLGRKSSKAVINSALIESSRAVLREAQQPTKWRR